MERIGIVAISYEPLGDLLGLGTSAAEDDSVDIGVVVDDTLQCGVLVPCWDRYVEMLDVRIRFVERTYLHLVGIADIVVGYLPHLSAHGGGKEPMLHLLRYRLQNLLQISLETHVEHHIRFV